MRCAYTTGLGEVLVINRIKQGALHHLNEPLSLTMGLDYSTSPPVILMGRSGPLRSLSRSNVFPFRDERSFTHFHRRVGQVRSPHLVADNRGLCTYYLLHLRIAARQCLCLDNTLGSWGF